MMAGILVYRVVLHGLERVGPVSLWFQVYNRLMMDPTDKFIFREKEVYKMVPYQLLSQS